MLSIIVINLVNAKFTLDEERLLKADTGKGYTLQLQNDINNHYTARLLLYL